MEDYDDWVRMMILMKKISSIIIIKIKGRRVRERT